MHERIIRSTLLAMLAYGTAAVATGQMPPNAGPLPQPVAMVLEVRGKAAVGEGPAATPLRPAFMLCPGNRLTVEPNAVLKLIFLTDEPHYEVLKAGIVTIGETTCEPQTAVERIAAPALRDKLPVNRLKTANTSLGATGGAAGVFRGNHDASRPPVSPMIDSVVISDRPRLGWPDYGPQAKYEVTVRTGGTNQLLWETTTAAAFVDYSAPPPLKRARLYRWQVVVHREGHEPVEHTSQFLVATTDEAKELARLQPLAASKDVSDLLLAALGYEAYGIYDDALEVYEKLVQAAPREVHYLIACARYYEQAGRTDDAKRMWQKAEALGRRNAKVDAG
jgi:hypothetical protein